MRVVQVASGSQVLSSSSSSSTLIPLDTAVALDRTKSIPFPAGSRFWMDSVAGNGSGSQRRNRDVFFIPGLDAGGLNMTRRKHSSAATGVDDTFNCLWLEFTEGGVAEGLVRAILTFDGVTASTSAPTSTESLNGTWPGNVTNADDLFFVVAYTSDSASSSTDGPEGHVTLGVSGTTVTVYPGGPGPDMDVVVWAIELTGAQHSVQSIEFTQTDYASQLAASSDYVPGAAYSPGDVFRAPLYENAASQGKFVVTSAVASAPALSNGLLADGWQSFAHYVGWDEQSFELSFSTAVNWSKTLIDASFNHTDSTSNPMDNGQLIVKPGSSTTKVSCEIGYADAQRTDPTSRRGRIQLWQFDSPAITVASSIDLLGRDDSQSPAFVAGDGEYDNARDSVVPLDLDTDTPVGSYLPLLSLNSDDRSENDQNVHQVIRLSEDSVSTSKRRSVSDAVQTHYLQAMQGLDQVTASSQPGVDFTIVSGDSQSYTLRATVVGALAGTITTLNGLNGDTVAANGGATATVAEFDIVAADHVLGGDLEHTPTGEPVSLSVTDGTETTSLSAITLPGAWQEDITYSKANSPSESVLKLITEDSSAGDKLDIYSVETARATEEGRPYNESNPWNITAKVYRRSTGQWTSAHTEAYSLTLGGDYSLSFSGLPIGDYDLPSPWVSIDSLQLESDGVCVRPKALGELGRFYYNEPFAADTLIVTTTLAGAGANDPTKPAIWLSGGRGYYIDITTSGGGEPDRIELKRMDGGTTPVSINFFIIGPLDTNEVSIRYFRPTGAFDVLVDGAVVGSVTDTTFQNSTLYPGLFFQARNVNAGCISSVQVLGLSGLRIASCNGVVTPQSLVDGATFTLEYTQDHAATDITITDEVGGTSVHTPTVLGPRQQQITLSLANLRKGPVTISAQGVAGTKGGDYPAPTGFKSVDLGSTLDLVGTTASWAADNELTYASTTVEGNPVTIAEDGNIEIASGELWQRVTVREHDSGVYGADETIYVFRAITEDFTAPTSLQFGTGQTVDIDLEDYYNRTVTLPDDQVGSSGTLSITDTGLSDAGLAIVGTRIQGTMTAVAGTYPATVTVIDPAGNSRDADFSFQSVGGNTAANAPAALVNQSAVEGIDGEYTFAAWTDPDGDPVTYSVTGAAYVSIPDPSQPRVIWTNPTVGTPTITITGQSTQGDTTPSSRTFTLTVAQNQAAQPPASLNNQSGSVGVTGSYQFEAWTDPEGDEITYSVSGGTFLSVDSASRTVTWTTPPSGTITVTVTGQSVTGNTSPSDRTFELVIAGNQPPVVLQPISPLGAQAGVAASIPLPTGTFSDPENGPLVITVTRTDGNPEPGVTYNASANALDVDHGIGVVELRATATDQGGLSVSTDFDLTFSLGAPVRISDITNLVWEIGQPITSLDLNVVFDGIPDTYEITPLIDGVTVTNDLLNGTPAQGLDPQTLSVVIRARNAAGFVDSNTFTVELTEAYSYQRTARHLRVPAA